MVSKNNYRSNSPKGLLGQLRISKIVKIEFSPFDCPGCYMTRCILNITMSQESEILKMS